MTNLKHLLLLVPAFILLSACTAETGCAPESGRDLADPDAPQPSCAETSSPNTMIISYPVTDGIEQLSGESASIYSRKGAVIVTDQNGNAVPDGTLIQLDVFDTLIAKGFIESGDSISGLVISDTDPTRGNGTTVTTLNSASVSRQGDSYRTIKSGDLIILQGANSTDQVRYISSTKANSVTVTSPYNYSYPNATYPNAQYLIGQSLVGTSILGIDDEGNKTAGYTTTKDGVGSFRLEYPGDTAHLGYGASENDPRTEYSPAGSTEVWVIADTRNGLAVASRTALPGIADSTVSAFPTTVTVHNTTVDDRTEDVTILVRDAKNVAYPLRTITASSSDTTAVTVSSGCTTGSYGSCTLTVTWVATNAAAATITVNAGTASTTFTAKAD